MSDLKRLQFIFSGTSILSNLSRVSLLAICLVLASHMVHADSTVNPNAEDDAIFVMKEINEQLKHASTYFWFGMAEKGNMVAFGLGCNHLKKAKELLKNKVEALTPDMKASLDQDIYALEHSIDALAIDFEKQMAVHEDTLFGIFPLVRLMAPSLFADALSAGTFELVDDPAVMASTAAGLNMARDVIVKWTARGQLDVIFCSIPDNKDLEAEVLYIFNSYPKFFVHNYQELTSILPTQELDHFNTAPTKNKITPGIREKICEHFNITDFLLVAITETDQIAYNHFYTLEGLIYNANSEEPTNHFSNMGFSRNRNAQVWPIIVTKIIFFLSAILFFVLYSLFSGLKKPSKKTMLLVPIIAFFIGRAAPWALIPLVSSIAPVPETLAKLSFWWPMAAGALLLLAPLFIFRLLLSRIGSFLHMETTNKGGAIGVAVGIGVCAYLSVPVYLFMEGGGVETIIALVLASTFALFTLGRALDSDSWFLIFCPCPIIAILGIGPALMRIEPKYLWICFAVAAIPVVVQWLKVFFTQHDSDVIKTNVYDNLPADAEELSRRTSNPNYIPFDDYQKVMDRVAPLISGEKNNTIWLGLEGAAGVGKTATAEQMLSTIMQQQKNKAVYLRGDCPEADSSGGETSTPFAPFQKALASHFKIDLLSPPKEELKKIDSAVEEAMTAFIPFAGMLFPAAGNSTNPMNNEEEIFAGIAKTFQKLAKNKMILLFIDDVHWIDPTSNRLLLYLLKTFPLDGPFPMLVVLTFRGCEKEICKVLDERDLSIKIKSLHLDQRITLLETNFGLANNVATKIAKKITVETQKVGGLFWMYRVVAHLADNGYFTKQDDNFVWSDKYSASQDLPIPDDFKSSLITQIKKAPEYQALLECAACHGMEFSATVLAQSLKMDRLDLLQTLKAIEDKTGIIYDVRKSDDIFAFSSSFMLEMLRKKMLISGKGPTSSDVPQLIREYHYRLACTLKEYPTKIYEVAKHFYASGKSHAAEAMDHCLNASHSLRKDFHYSQARKYLDMTRECAEATNAHFDWENEKRIIDREEAHVRNVQLKEVADTEYQYIKTAKAVSVDDLIHAARACYDCARNITKDNQEYFKKTVEIGHIIVKRGEGPVHKAEGHQFIELGMPRDQEHKVERIENLRAALKLLDDVPAEDKNGQGLAARIMDSLGLLLTYGKTRNLDEAEQLFKQSIEIKSRPDINDKKGLTMSHGGLGRVYFEAGNIDDARKHFQKDLDLSREFKDDNGVSQMLSSLALCDIKEGKWENACKKYSRSAELSTTPMNSFFALSGLLLSLKTLNKTEEDEYTRTGNELLSLAQDQKSIPYPCRQTVRDAIDGSGVEMADWKEALLNFIE